MQAWLDTAKKGINVPRRNGWSGGEPEPGHLEYIGDWLYEVGPIKRGQDGLSPVYWGDIAGWAELSGVDMEPWEAVALKEVAHAYFVQAANSHNTDEPSPWMDATRIDHAEQARRARRRHGK